MTQTSVDLVASVDDAWPQLQELQTWDGVAGLENLCNEAHGADGNLQGFDFSIDTSVGRVNGNTTVSSQKPAMTVTADQKGVAISLSIVLREAPVGSIAMVEASAKATSFMAKPLAKAINTLLDKGLAKEAAMLAERIR